MNKEEFGNFLTSIIQNGCLMAAIGIGHDLGLFKVICEAEKPMSLTEIAESLNLKERYTKEWLSTMVAAGIILQDRHTGLYTLPPDHKPALQAISGFAPVLFQFGFRSEKLKKCFKKDGPYGISYAESPEWFDWFNGYRSMMCDMSVEGEIIPLFTKQGIIPKLENGIKVLDFGCGSGNYANALAQRFPNSTFVGLDISARAIEIANATKEKKELENITFINGELRDLESKWNGSFDMVFVCDVLHDLPNPFKALELIYRVLKVDGFLSLIEIGVHSNPVDNAGDKGAAMYYACSLFMCLPSSMTEEPHIGYGACWGSEEIEKAVTQANFKIPGDSSKTVIGTTAIFYCTK